MMPRIRWILFDCDNTLVLSEDLAFEVLADVCNQILEDEGISKRYTGDELIADFVGQNFRGMVTSLETKYGFKISRTKFESYREKEEAAVIAKLAAKARPCIGATEVLEELQRIQKYEVAVVSSSALPRVRASIQKAGQDRFFLEEHIFSAATSLKKPTSKPDPAVYLHACKAIGASPGECIAVEDSKSGATAALRAGIPCIAYVGSTSGRAKQDEIGEVLTGPGVGCKVVMHHWSEFSRCLAQVEAMQAGI